MEWLNYHHLFYFHAVVREGGVAAAARKLRISHPTVSTQLRLLEAALGEPLFERGGRTLVLTDTGRFVAGYAEEIFSLGKELLDGVRMRPTSRAPRLAIGISDPVPKLVARRLLATYDSHEPPVRLTLRQASTPELVTELLAHRLDAVLTDAAGPASSEVFDHFLGECGTTFFAAPPLLHTLEAGAREFPRMLDGAPFLLPGPESALRRALEDFFAKRDLHPRVVAEVDDSALLKVIGQDGVGVFAGPTPLASEICAQYRVVRLGEVDSVRERYHLLTTERRIAAPLISRLVSQSHDLFPGRRRRR
jgi:LysR family transcriptional activator of nhaA